MTGIEAIEKIKPGMLIVVNERIKEKDKERTTPFRGIVLARKNGTQKNATFTVRSVVDSVGVEKIYPFHSPLIASIKIVTEPTRVRRAKLYYLRKVSKRMSRKKIGVSL